ncbi:MAG: hypothetical protein EBT06_08100, partial [Gammaproteobacteria bacterium]|nr:hypothetical protein [Gammaproteobacteria bacterium]
ESKRGTNIRLKAFTITMEEADSGLSKLQSGIDAEHRPDAAFNLLPSGVYRHNPFTDPWLRRARALLTSG